MSASWTTSRIGKPYRSRDPAIDLEARRLVASEQAVDRGGFAQGGQSAVAHSNQHCVDRGPWRASPVKSGAIFGVQ
jgi:hypothetical protein